MAIAYREFFTRIALPFRWLWLSLIILWLEDSYRSARDEYEWELADWRSSGQFDNARLYNMNADLAERRAEIDIVKAKRRAL